MEREGRAKITGEKGLDIQISLVFIPVSRMVAERINERCEQLMLGGIRIPCVLSELGMLIKGIREGLLTLDVEVRWPVALDVRRGAFASAVEGGVVVGAGAGVGGVEVEESGG